MGWKRVFLEHVFLQRPVVLCIGGHKSHMTLDLINLCHTSGVILFCLPLAYHLCFAAIRRCRIQVPQRQFLQVCACTSFHKEEFYSVKAWVCLSGKRGYLKKAFSMSNVKASFPKTGIYPNAIGTDKMKHSEFYTALNASGSSSSSRSHSTSAEASVLMPGRHHQWCHRWMTHRPELSVSHPISGPLIHPPLWMSSSAVPNTPTPLTVTPPQLSSTPGEYVIH